MRTTQRFLSSNALLILGLSPLALAQSGHGEHDHGAPQAHSMGSMNMTMHADPSSEPAAPPSYWMHPEHVSLMYAHIALSIFAWAVLLPIAVMLSVARSRLRVPAQVAFLFVNVWAVFTGIIYDAQTPDLYENNSHHLGGWIVTCIATVWCTMGLVTLYTDRKTAGSSAQNEPLLQQRSMAKYQRVDNSEDRARWSDDSGHGTDRNTASLSQSSRSNSWNTDLEGFPRHVPHDESDDEEGVRIAGEKQDPMYNSRIDGFLSKHVPRYATGAPLHMFNFLYVLLERFMVLLGFFGIISGFIVYGGIMRGVHVFGGLAHFIKGAIFFWYGLLTLGRWMGCFSDFGWAWHLKPGSEIVGRRKARIPSAEFTESFVIWLYGASNVFLEHMTNWGGVYSATDLEHISITIMFFGGGLLGMLIESTTIRSLLATSLPTAPDDHDHDKTSMWTPPKSYAHPMNPMPALTIMLLGLMMSSHTQHSHVAGAVHKQWGTLFVGFALARAATYLIMWIKPPKSYIPTRPPSEVVAAFCLVSGGAIFMASNQDSVHALETYDLDAMFVFTVMMGLTALVMAWAVILVALKGWAERREQRSAARP